MAPDPNFRRQRLIAPQVRSQRAASRLLHQMRALGSDRVLSGAAWRTATQLPLDFASDSRGRGIRLRWPRW